MLKRLATKPKLPFVSRLMKGAFIKLHLHFEASCNQGLWVITARAVEAERREHVTLHVPLFLRAGRRDHIHLYQGWAP